METGVRNDVGDLSSLPIQRGEAKLELLNSPGERIAVLVDGVQGSGARTFRYETDALPNGPCFIRLTVDGLSVVRTVLKVE